MDFKVLILDPAGHVPGVLCDALRLHGFDVIARATTDDEALRAALGARPDVLVIDHQPPDTDGIAAVARLRRRVPGVPLILYPAFLDARTAALGRAAGAAACIGRTEGVETLEREICALCLGRIA